MAASGRGVLPPGHRCSGGSADILASALPNFTALLSDGRQVLEVLWVNNIPYVGGHPAEEEDLLDLVHQGGLQGVELNH